MVFLRGTYASKRFPMSESSMLTLTIVEYTNACDGVSAKANCEQDLFDLLYIDY